jgi:thiol-disulfide isomerase/thioredoxin
MAVWKARAFALATLWAFPTCFLSAPQDSSVDSRAEVNFFLSTDCPVAQRQAPRMAALVSEFKKRKISFRAYFPNALETSAKITSYLKERKLDVPFVIDRKAVQAKRFEVEVVPTVILVDKQGKILYFGAFDDAKASNQVRKSYLRIALEDHLAGRSIRAKFGKPFGCFLMPER